MVEVGRYPTRADAELARSVLAAAGIPSVLAADDAGGAYPFDLSGGARISVAEADAEDAVRILSDQAPHERSNDEYDNNDNIGPRAT